MSKELMPLEANVKLYQMIGSAGNGGDFNLVEAWEYKTIIENALKDFEELKKGIALRKAELEKELHSGIDCDGVPLSEKNKMIISNLYNIICALEDYYK